MSISELYRAQLPVSPTGTTSPTVPANGTRGTGNLKGPSEFNELLKKQTINFSQHAQNRIQSRDIPWSPEMEKRVSQGIDAAEKKGSREALILADDVAVIANVKSRTVITAMDRTQMKEKIFTNIDSAVLV